MMRKHPPAFVNVKVYELHRVSEVVFHCTRKTIRVLELLPRVDLNASATLLGCQWINSQSIEDAQVGCILQKYTLDRYTLQSMSVCWLVGCLESITDRPTYGRTDMGRCCVKIFFKNILKCHLSHLLVRRGGIDHNFSQILSVGARLRLNFGVVIRKGLKINFLKYVL